MCEHYEWFKHNYIMGECRGRVYLRTERRSDIDINYCPICGERISDILSEPPYKKR